MTIYEMLFREDIYGIIESTLHDYYKELEHKNVSIKIEKNIFKNSFVVYPRIGVVIHRIPSLSVLKDIYISFDVQNNILKKIIVWSYITLCVCSFGLLAKRSLYISDRSLLKRYMCIMPCNRKIRLFNYKEGTVDAVLKTGFSNYFLKEEINIRNTLKSEFVPRLISYGDFWYREKILPGRGLVRVPSRFYDKYCNKTANDIKELVLKNLEYKRSDIYIRSLKSHIILQLDILKEKKDLHCIDYLKSIINKCDDIYNKEDFIPISSSHGDLQTGNIWVDLNKDKLTILDWETYSKRSVWYDSAILFFMIRRKDMFSNLIQSIYNNEQMGQLLINDPRKNCSKNTIISVLVLEELIFFTDEICDLPKKMGVEIIERFLYEMKRITLFN